MQSPSVLIFPFVSYVASHVAVICDARIGLILIYGRVSRSN